MKAARFVEGGPSVNAIIRIVTVAEKWTMHVDFSAVDGLCGQPCYATLWLARVV
jgi:hypothetical protein